MIRLPAAADPGLTPALHPHPDRPTRLSGWLSGLVLASLACATSAQAASIQVTVLDRDGKPLPDAVVVVTPPAGAALRGAKPPLPLQASINQEKMQFVPAVTIVGLGAKVRFLNSDPWDHHVRLTLPGLPPAASASATDGVALRLEGKSDGKPAKFADVVMDKPGALGANIMGCFIHGSMSGHIYVAESPWTVKTGPDGVAQIDNLPEGNATVQVWHGLLTVAPKPQAATLGAVPGKSTVHLDVLPRRRRT